MALNAWLEMIEQEPNATMVTVLPETVQTAGEVEAKGVTHDVVKRLMPPGALVTQQVEVGRDSVAVRLISTRVVPEEKFRDAEREIERRSGR